jgi:hypothetical protein
MDVLWGYSSFALRRSSGTLEHEHLLVNVLSRDVVYPVPWQAGHFGSGP